jgi:deoxyadenosine/deoxycytidine kinase
MRIVIDGNIASGKSTQFDLLEKQGFKVLSERIYDWPLELFYEDPSRWALLLQFSILKSFDDNRDKAIIFERSPESSRDVFWKMLCEDGTVKQQEDDVYKYFWEKNGWKPDIYIYIDTPPTVCYWRLFSRRQVGDSAVNIEYLRKVDQYYKNYLEGKVVHIIDGTLTTNEINNTILSILRRCFNDVQVLPEQASNAKEA